jgi:hypothetical protein
MPAFVRHNETHTPYGQDHVGEKAENEDCSWPHFNTFTEY